MIDAKYDGRVDVLASGRRDDHFFCSACKMRARLFLAGEQPGAFEYDIDTKVFPWQFRRITLGEHFDFISVNGHNITFNRDAAVKFTMHGIVACQVCIGFGVAKIVDCNDLNVVFFLALIMGAQNIAPNPAIAVDCYPNGHVAPLLVKTLVCYCDQAPRVPTCSLLNTQKTATSLAKAANYLRNWRLWLLLSHDLPGLFVATVQLDAEMLELAIEMGAFQSDAFRDS